MKFFNNDFRVLMMLIKLSFINFFNDFFSLAFLIIIIDTRVNFKYFKGLCVHEETM